MSKRNALRALKQERRVDVDLYVEAMVPDDALASRQARKGLKARKARSNATAQHRRFAVRP